MVQLHCHFMGTRCKASYGQTASVGVPVGCVRIAKAALRYCTCVVLLSENVRKYIYMMKKISRRSFLQVCGITAATAALTACGSGKAEGDKSSSQNGKIQITFYLWDRSMMKALTPWLEEKFPEYAFNFIQGFNTMDYYRDLLNRAEQLPDIITCRRFSLNDAAPLAEHLMDQIGRAHV